MEEHLTVKRGRFRLIGIMISVLFLTVGTMADAETMKLGYVDAQKVLENTNGGERAKSKMQEFVQSRQKIIDLDETEIQQLQEDLQRQASILSPEARQSKEESLQRKMMSYQKRAGEMNKEVQDKNREILMQFNKNLQAVVKKVAEKGGYTYVLDQNAEGGVILYAAEGLDLTDAVIKEFEKIFP